MRFLYNAHATMMSSHAGTSVVRIKNREETAGARLNRTISGLIVRVRALRPPSVSKCSARRGGGKERISWPT